MDQLGGILGGGSGGSKEFGSSQADARVGGGDSISFGAPTRLNSIMLLALAGVSAVGLLILTVLFLRR